MDFNSYYENLLKQTSFKEGEGLTHNFNKNTPIFPFRTHTRERPIFKNGFKNILGEFSRLILDKKSFSDDFRFIIDNIVNSKNITYKATNEDKKDAEKDVLKYLLNDYLFDDNDELNIIHPFLFTYIPENNNYNRRKGEYEVALFFKDVFFSNESFRNKFKLSFLEKFESNQILLNLIYDNMPELDEKNDESKYLTILNFIIEYFEKDINFLLDNNHDKFLLENIDLIFAYYYFYYCSQLMIKICQDFSSDIEKSEKLYYLLDWESMSEGRATRKKGFSYITTYEKEVYTRVHLIEHLNILMGSKGLLLPGIKDKFNNLTPENQEEFLKHLNLWIKNYQGVKDIKLKDNENKLLSCKDINLEFEKSVNILFKSMHDTNESGEFKGIGEAIRGRYSHNITEEFAKQYFVKSRGQYSFVLNLNQDMFYVLTALCIHEDKIKLNDLFKEYENRGLFFDNASQEVIMDWLNNQNLLDKKSDSEEAQYVKSIL